MHGQHTKQGYEAGDAGEAIPVCTRVPLPREREASAGHTRHCVTKISDSNLHQRMLLAWARGLPILCATQDKHSLLESED